MITDRFGRPEQDERIDIAALQRPLGKIGGDLVQTTRGAQSGQRDQPARRRVRVEDVGIEEAGLPASHVLIEARRKDVSGKREGRALEWGCQPDGGPAWGIRLAHVPARDRMFEFVPGVQNQFLGNQGIVEAHQSRGRHHRRRNLYGRAVAGETGEAMPPVFFGDRHE